jgi:hypothetical protein
LTTGGIIKLRISIYGSKKVVESLAAFSKTGEILNTPESQKSFVTLLKLMRTENIDERHIVSEEDLAQIFFSPTPPPSLS